jgi:hypothetical protein
MNLIIETKFKKGIKAVDTLAVSLDTDQLTKIAATKGLAAANKAIDSFVEKYTADLKARLGAALNK